jgi:hypothetical protein
MKLTLEFRYSAPTTMAFILNYTIHLYQEHDKNVTFFFYFFLLSTFFIECLVTQLIFFSVPIT